MKIRKAGIRDIPQLIKLYHNVKEIQDYAGMKHDKKYFLSLLKSRSKAIYVCDQDHKIIGAMDIEFEEGVYTFLNAIVISCEYRGKRVGRTLLKKLEAIAKKKKTHHTLMFVYEWNKGMQKIVEHYQYKSRKKLIIYSKKI